MKHALPLALAAARAMIVNEEAVGMQVHFAACLLADKHSRAGALAGYFLRNPQLQGSGRQALYIAAVAAFNIALGASQGSMIDNSGAGDVDALGSAA